MDREEGAWREEALVLGFDVNAQSMQISIPPGRVQGEADFILPDEFSAGYKHLLVKNLRILRGLLTRWLNSCMFWKTCLQPIYSLLSHAIEDSETIQCDDPELFNASWPMFQMLRNLASDAAMWPMLFIGGMGEYWKSTNDSPPHRRAEM